MVGRSALVDVRPFRTGLAVLGLGLLLTLGSDGGYLGDGPRRRPRRCVGGTGVAIVGVLALVAGILLLSGASAGALIRRGGTRRRAAPSTARPPEPSSSEPPELISTANAAALPPVDGASDFPDVVGRAEPAPLIPFPEVGRRGRRAGPGEPLQRHADRPGLPPAGPRPPPQVRHRTAPPPPKRAARSLTPCRRRSPTSASRPRVVGQIVGPRVTRYELQLAPGTKMSKVSALKDDLSYALATTEIRILAPIPGKQAVGVEVPNLTPNLVTLGDIYDDLPQTASPLAVWLGKDISGNAVWTDLARMPHILIAGTTGSGKSGCINTILTSVLLRADAGRGADDPHRPEADRAQLLRVDPAPAGARRLEPEGGDCRARQRDQRDGAPLRAAEQGAGPQPARRRTAPSASAASRRSRTCSSSSTSSPT